MITFKIALAQLCNRSGRGRDSPARWRRRRRRQRARIGRYQKAYGVERAAATAKAASWRQGGLPPPQHSALFFHVLPLTLGVVPGLYDFEWFDFYHKSTLKSGTPETLVC